MKVNGAASLTVLFLAPAVLSGCGDRGDGTESAPQGSVAAELEFVYRADESAEPERAELTCPDGAGSRTDACLALEEVPTGTFDPVPAGTACTKIYGGPATLRVTGRFGDETIESGFSRVDGCEIARWDAISPVLRPLGVGEVGQAIAR